MTVPYWVYSLPIGFLILALGIGEIVVVTLECGVNPYIIAGGACAVVSSPFLERLAYWTIKGLDLSDDIIKFVYVWCLVCVLPNIACQAMALLPFDCIYTIVLALATGFLTGVIPLVSMFVILCVRVNQRVHESQCCVV